MTDSKSNSNGVAAYRLFATALMRVMLSIGVLQLAGVIRICRRQMGLWAFVAREEPTSGSSSFLDQRVRSRAQ